MCLIHLKWQSSSNFPILMVQMPFPPPQGPDQKIRKTPEELLQAAPSLVVEYYYLQDKRKSGFQSPNRPYFFEA